MVLNVVVNPDYQPVFLKNPTNTSIMKTSIIDDFDVL